VYPDYGLVTLVSPLPHGVFHGIAEPPVQVVAERHLAGVEHEARVGVRAGFPESLTRFLFILPGDVAAPAVGTDVCTSSKPRSPYRTFEL
jgi:hypothetical protein